MNLRRAVVLDVHGAAVTAVPPVVVVVAAWIWLVVLVRGADRACRRGRTDPIPSRPTTAGWSARSPRRASSCRRGHPAHCCEPAPPLPPLPPIDPAVLEQAVLERRTAAGSRCTRRRRRPNRPSRRRSRSDGLSSPPVAVAAVAAGDAAIDEAAVADRRRGVLDGHGAAQRDEP